MGLSIGVGETRPVLNQNGTPIASSTQPDLPKGPGLAATIQDQAGTLVCVGNFAGSLPFNVYGPGGVVVQHVVTVTGGDFDWSLGGAL